MSDEFIVLDHVALSSVIPSTTEHLILFSSYSENSVIDDNVFNYANAIISGIGFQSVTQVLFLTNNRELSNSTIQRAESIGKLIRVPNQVMDFGMWARVLYTLCLSSFPNLKTLILVNDSCNMVNSVELQKLIRKHIDIPLWGITDSLEIEPHLQSYFLVFQGTESIEHVLAWFKRKQWSWMTRADKDKVVLACEIGLSAWMAAKYGALHAVYPYTDVIKVKGTASDQILNQGNRYPIYNPSMTFWDKLAVMGCPLIKKKRIILPSSNYNQSVFATMS